MTVDVLRKTVPLPPLPGCKALETLEPAARALFEKAVAGRRALPPRCELVKDGERLSHPQMILEGWAARACYRSDGRRQIVAFVLPGELIGVPVGDAWTATSSIVSITRVQLCHAPAAGVSPAIDKFYAAQRLAEERSLLAQIVRLSQMTAYERIGNLLLDLWGRLATAGSTTGGRFYCPLTQDMLADAVGLTPVHVNRTLQALRKDDLIVWRGRDVTVDPDRLATRVGR